MENQYRVLKIGVTVNRRHRVELLGGNDGTFHVVRRLRGAVVFHEVTTNLEWAELIIEGVVKEGALWGVILKMKVARPETYAPLPDRESGRRVFVQ